MLPDLAHLLLVVALVMAMVACTVHLVVGDVVEVRAPGALHPTCPTSPEQGACTWPRRSVYAAARLKRGSSTLRRGVHHHAAPQAVGVRSTWLG